jgi:UDP-glucose 4-epimerase
MILVTGGAGYIGSHFVQQSVGNGAEIVVLDNLAYGHREAVPEGVELIVGDMADRTLLEDLFSTHCIDSVVHFAAFAYVGESVTEPRKYYGNNTVATLNLLNTMVDYDVKRFVFSSTCATYGNPEYTPMDESHPQSPINPYGESKWFVEKILWAYGQAYGLKSAALRYFNAAGCDPEGRIGESHDPETHLIPLILQAALGKRESIGIFGTDYDTPDGTCIRDYIHVLDLARAHNLALNYLEAGGESSVFNLGTGTGNSVREVIESCKTVTGLPINVAEHPRRAGDPPRLIASATKAKTVLGWEPEYTDINEIISTAWNWETNRTY